MSLARSFSIREMTRVQFHLDAINALNNVNLYLPKPDQPLALKSDGTYSTTSLFGQSS
jgi:hypothetical protein